MTRRYLLLALTAFVTYSLVAPVLKVAMRTLPSTTAVFLSNLTMFVLIGGLLAYRRAPLRTYLGHPRLPYVVAWGVLLAVGLLSYYRALALGPVSVVVPVYGLFIVVSSLVGVVALDETLTVRKAAGVGFAVLAIALMSI